jgi:transposase InsO family protein
MLFWNKKKKEKKSETKPLKAAGDVEAADDDRKVAGAEAPAKPLRAPAPGKPRKAPQRTPLEVKLAAVAARDEGLTAREVAELTGVSPEAVEQWGQAHAQGGVAALAKKSSTASTRRLCAQLTERIEARRREHPEQGVRRIRDELRRDEGLAVSAEKVRQVVNEAGLGQAPPRPGPRPPAVRRFERELPNVLWQTDIFTFTLKGFYPVYLIGLIDDHSRYLVGHGLYRQQTTEAVLEVVKGAIGQWGAPREVLSDNGRQYAAWRGETRFQQLLKARGIQHVRSAPHHPMTLGKIERFWKTLWTEYLHEAVFVSFADAAQRLAHWVAYYNHQRPHQALNGQCPADRFYGVAGDVAEAVRQGCADNALRLAWGDAPQPPLFLLGKLGGTDVRVVRQGEAIEVQVGDTVREVIRLGAPCAMDEQGRMVRPEVSDAVVRAEPRGEVPGGGAGGVWQDPRGGAVRDLRGEPADASCGAGEGAGRGGGGVGAPAAGAQAAERGDGGARGAESGAGEDPGGGGALAAALRGGEDLPGARAEAGAGRAAAGGDPGGGKKNQPSGTPGAGSEAGQGRPPGGCDAPTSSWARWRAGRRRPWQR